VISLPVLLLLLGAHFRLTRLLTDDTITRPLRDWCQRRADWLGTLAECYWCAGLWIAAALAPLAWWHGRSPWFEVPALALTVSWLYGITASWLDQPPPPRHLYIHQDDLPPATLLEAPARRDEI